MGVCAKYYEKAKLWDRAVVPQVGGPESEEMTGRLSQPWKRARWAHPACPGVLRHHAGAPAQVVTPQSPLGQGGLQRSRLLHRAPGEEVLGPTKGPQE